MARYRDRSRDQSYMLPVHLADQLQPGTFEYTIDYLVNNEINLSAFDSRYDNDETGAPAYDPAILLNVVLFAYSRGITRSRRIARACEENVVFMALSADSRPHFTTIAEFINSMSEQIESVFTDVLTVCYTEELIGKKMFAVDGCKISSNCAKEWSGTKAELRKKAERIEESVKMLLARHKDDDAVAEPGQREREERAAQRLSEKAKKVREFLKQNDDRIGSQGKPVKSNITDNESAKMHSGHGVIKGYNGIATVDEKAQIVVDAQAFGDGHEAKHVGEVIESVDKTFRRLDPARSIYKDVVVTADSGFHSEAATRAVFDRGVDAYIADTLFRKRDPRFANQQEYKAKTTDKRRTSQARKFFSPADFHFNEEGTLICPAGNPMRWRTRNYTDANRGYTGRCYSGSARYCTVCELRAKCIRGKKTQVKAVTIIDHSPRAIQKMIERFDTDRGRHYYSRRMGTVEPVFANITSTYGLNRFSLRGRKKVDAQWKLFCMVHNIGKIAAHWRRAKEG